MIALSLKDMMSVCDV